MCCTPAYSLILRENRGKKGYVTYENVKFIFKHIA